MEAATRKITSEHTYVITHGLLPHDGRLSGVSVITLASSGDNLVL